MYYPGVFMLHFCSSQWVRNIVPVSGYPCSARLRTSPRSTGLLTLLAISALLLTGCASFSRDGGFDPVAHATHDRLGKELIWSKSPADEEAIHQRVNALLEKPVSVDDAVQVALLNHRGLQATFAELAISEANLVQAGRLPNPGITLLHASAPTTSGMSYTVEQVVSFRMLSLLTMPQTKMIAQRQFKQTQQKVILDVVRLAAETRQTYYNAVAAAQSVQYAQQVCEAAEAGAELARRMAKAGNFNKLQQAREERFYADAQVTRAQYQQIANSYREQLIRLMGLSDQRMALQLPMRLPDLPSMTDALPNIERLAMEQRLDLQISRLQTEALATQLGLTKTTRFVNVLDIGPASVLEGSGNTLRRQGYEVSVELPLFDWGDAKVTRAEALYMQSLHQTAQIAINAQSEVRQAYDVYQSNYEIARHYRDTIVPLRKQVNDENLLRYNGMLISVFDLLEDARDHITTVNKAIEATRDFWIAQATLTHALIGQPIGQPIGQTQNNAQRVTSNE